MRLVLLFVLSLFSCQSQNINQSSTFDPIRKNFFSKKDLTHWYLADYKTDTIPGISLSKAYKFLKGKKSKEVLVAVVDAPFDLDNKDLAGKFWINPDEVENQKDDDGNGFIDDIHGWNFIGNQNGALPMYENYEFVRVVRYYDNIFKGKKTVNDTTLSEQYETYLKAKKFLDDEITNVNEEIERGNSLIADYYQGLDTISIFLDEGKLSLSILDSLEKAHPKHIKQIKAVKLLYLYEMTIADLKEDVEFRKRLNNIYYNVDYDERKEIGDDVNDINDSIYGNNRVDGLKDTISHGTYVSSLIAATRNNKIGIDGIVNNVKILPVVVAVNGEASDKDLALGIKYAVDKGAEIINISINKFFSLQKEWVFDAIRYAEDHDVLIVVAGGNDAVNIDDGKNNYPNDTDYDSPEFTNNFIMAGGSSYNIMENLFYSYSNYGKETVDILAPGEEIYTSGSDNKYSSRNGTSYSAPIVTGVAALLKSYYPVLTSGEIKDIILKSGSSYNVSIKMDAESEESIPFSALSKSGKIVNAYNAVLMADEYVKNKKK